MKKVKSLDSKLFKTINTESLSAMGNIMGGKDTKSSATGWTCKDDRDGADAGPWTPKAVAENLGA